MTDAIHDRLEATFDTHRIDRQLHDVPPHEVWVVRVDGERAVYKADTGPTGAAGVEGHGMRFVHEHTDCPVPAVLAAEGDWFVARWHPGAPDPDAPEPADLVGWARAAGRGLAELHAATEREVAAYGRFRVGDDGLRIEGHDRWHDAVLAILRHRRSVLERFGHADVVASVEAVLRDRPSALEGVGPPVCCHGWATPEHVGVADGRVTCLLDFEHALAAPAAWDYWRTVGPTFGLDASPVVVENGDGTTDASDADRAHGAFRAGYEAVRELPEGTDRLRESFQLLNLVYALQSLHVQAQHDADATAERADGLRERIAATLDRLR